MIIFRLRLQRKDWATLISDSYRLLAFGSNGLGQFLFRYCHIVPYSAKG